MRFGGGVGHRHDSMAVRGNLLCEPSRSGRFKLVICELRFPSAMGITGASRAAVEVHLDHMAGHLVSGTRRTAHK